VNNPRVYLVLLLLLLYTRTFRHGKQAEVADDAEASVDEALAEPAVLPSGRTSHHRPLHQSCGKGRAAVLQIREAAMDNKEIVKAGYDRIAASYLASRNQEQEDVRLLDELIAQLPAGAKVLDAGCGAGVPIARILSRHFEVTGVDFSEAQVQMARQLVPEANFICQDITALTFTDASFDAICSYYAIIHIPREQHAALLRDFYRLLKPGGLALLCLGASDNPDDVDNYHGTTMYWSHYDAPTNLRLVGEAGFEILWQRLVTDSTYPTAAHLFVLARKPDGE